MYRFKIPDRWVDYIPFGDVIANTRIVAVKTPLQQIFRRSQRVPDGLTSEQMFTPTQLVDGLLAKSHLLSLVIDFTNTARYYDPKEFRDRGVHHVKIRCPGQTIPPDSVYKQFCFELERWLEQAKKGEVVAVHCTHGLNRTGYLVCRYMMEHNGLSFQSAVAAFNKARKHDIENQEYLDHLKQGCPPLPDLPPSDPIPPVASRDDAPPPNTRTRLPDNADSGVPSSKRPKYGDSPREYPRSHHKQDRHQSGLDDRRRGDYGYHGNHHGDWSHRDYREQYYHYHDRGTPDQQWSSWQHAPHYQWEPPSNFYWGRGEGMYDQHYRSDRVHGQWDDHYARGSGGHYRSEYGGYDRRSDNSGRDRRSDNSGRDRKSDNSRRDRRSDNGGRDRRSDNGGCDRSDYGAQGSSGHSRPMPTTSSPRSKVTD